jgi:hypothetical protein
LPYCTNCGTQERDDQRFCVVCGAATPGVSTMAAMPAMPSMPTSELTGEAQVRIGFSMDPPRQSRWTIFLRLFMSLPLLIAAAGIAIAAGFVTIAAWFCALITGRVPDDIQRFLTNSLRLYANVTFYAYFLTSRWPGISFNPKPHDQVTIDVDHVNLSRWAVFFRYPLLIPAAIVGSLLLYGSYPVLIVMWLWGTITGREPRPLHQALSLVLRYQIRYEAYALLMTPTQPFKGFFGDGRDSTSHNVLPVAASDAVPIAYVAPPQDPTLAFVAAPMTPTPSSSSLTNRWYVVKGAKVMVIVILVVSIPAYIVPFALAPPFLNGLSFANYWKTMFSRVLVAGAQQNVLNAMNQFQDSWSLCTSSQSSSCVASAATQAYNALSRQTQLLSNRFIYPSDALNKAVRYEASLDSLEAELLQLQSSTSFQFDQAILYTEIPTSLTASTAAYQALYVQLHK